VTGGFSGEAVGCRSRSWRAPRRLTFIQAGGHGADVSAYVISRVSIRDSAAMSRYVDQAPAAVAQFGGRYLVRANTATALEGDWDADRMVVLKFPHSWLLPR
jgi:uncharacterized protein DUF1330